MLYIAKELGVSVPTPPPTNEKIAELGASFVKANSDDLASNPRFQKLIVYHAGVTGGGRSSAKASGKSSADKAAEDVSEAQKPRTAPTWYVFKQCHYRKVLMCK